VSAPQNVQPNPGAQGNGVANLDALGNESLTGSLTLGGVMRLGAQSAAPVQTPGSLTLYSLDGNTLQALGAGGTPGAFQVDGTTDWFNAKAFGAVGDGVHDDTAAIAAALAAAAVKGGVAYVPTGTYATSASLVLGADGVYLIGDGMGATVIKPAAGANFDVISTAIPASAGTAGFIRNFVGVRDLTIDGSNMTGTTAGAGNGIHFYGVRYSRIYDVNITAVPNFGIVLDGDATNFSYSVHVRGCRIINGGAGFMATFSEETFFTFNNVLQANLATAAAQPAFAPQSSVGYLCRLVSGYAELVGNVWGSSGTYTSPAIQVENSGPVRIGYNRFDQCRYQAIKTNSPNVIIEGNQFGNPSSVGSVEGIRLGSGSNTIVGNKFDLTNGAAHFTYCIAEAAAESNNIIGANNLVAGTTGVINLNAASTGNRVFGNVGYNPVGAFGAQPAVPASTVPVTNNFGVDATVFVTGGTVSAIAIGGTATGVTSGSFRVPSGQTITLTYTVAPTWEWFGD
jgi:pectate lyase-like protein